MRALVLSLAVTTIVGLPVETTNCHVDTCDASARSQFAGLYKCGDRIAWLKSYAGYSEWDACHTVAVDEFPEECGACAPPAGEDEHPTRCGQKQCNVDVLSKDAGGYTCGARVSWLRVWAGHSETDACKKVAVDEFPDECGPCDPTQTVTAGPVVFKKLGLYPYPYNMVAVLKRTLGGVSSEELEGKYLVSAGFPNTEIHKLVAQGLTLVRKPEMEDATWAYFAFKSKDFQLNAYTFYGTNLPINADSTLYPGDTVIAHPPSAPPAPPAAGTKLADFPGLHLSMYPYNMVAVLKRNLGGVSSEELEGKYLVSAGFPNTALDKLVAQGLTLVRKPEMEDATWSYFAFKDRSFRFNALKELYDGNHMAQPDSTLYA